MILILSTRNDVNTDGVIEWLHYFKTPFFRLNDEDILNGNVQISFDLLKETFTIKGIKTVELDNIKAVWFRKFGFLNSYSKFFKKFDNASNLEKYTYSEFDKIRELMFRLLEKKKWLYQKKNMPTKSEVLMIAKNNNLNIPKTVITNRKSELERHFDSNDDIITKSLGEATIIKLLNTGTRLLTQKFKLEDLTQNEFAPSLFQKCLDKKFELRIFYIDGDFYPMAMFTQKNSQTSIDFRNYDDTTPPRRVPYKLPSIIKNRIDGFMKELGVNTGSIDMVYTKEKEYVFLEVNPTGQFGMTAVPCNYPLNEVIAKHLKTLC